MVVYGLIGWDYKPAHTSLYHVAASKEDCLEYVRGSYSEWLWNYNEDGLSEEECNKFAEQISYEDLENWMWENTSMVIDCVDVGAFLF